MRTSFYITIAVLLVIIGIAINNHTSKASVSALPMANFDTIRFEDGSTFLSIRTLLSGLEGYCDLLWSNVSSEVLANRIMGGGIGYRNNWVEKEGQLYLEKNLSRFPVGTHFSAEEWQEILEELTGEKFNEEGLLPANWLTGDFRLRRLVRAETRPIPSWRECRLRQYVFHFCSGRVTKIEITESGMSYTVTSLSELQ